MNIPILWDIMQARYTLMKTVLITGGARGIGRACARAFAKQGYRVAVNYLNSADAAAALKRGLSPVTDILTVKADVADPAAAEDMLNQIGPVDVLVNNAGVSGFGLLHETPPADWRRMLDVNLTGAYHCCRAALPGMIRKKSGVIINVSSIWGVTGASCEAAYSASKAGLIGLTKALAKEVGPSGIRVNCVAPGLIDTDMNQNLAAAARQVIIDETPLGRIGAPEDVAELIAFLASDAAGFITGQVIGIDGGLCK